MFKFNSDENFGIFVCPIPANSAAASTNLHQEKNPNPLMYIL